MADVALHSGDYREAHRLNGESLVLSRQSGYRSGIVRALVGLGNVASLEPATLDGRAMGYFEEALDTALTIQALPWVLSAVVGIAALWSQAGRREKAAELLTLALYHPACNRRTQDQATRLLSRLEADLPPEAVAEAEERGRRRRLDEAVRDIISERPQER
jgi:hypothetical protein